jgi:formiminotetrahydrofolate cyclodeaminase
MNSIPQRITPGLLQLDAQGLLAAFGAGNATPGSGSAAALNGALACELIATSAKLTHARTAKGEAKRRQECEYVLAQVNGKGPILQDLVQRDTDVFAQVIDARRARDRTKDATMRRKHVDRARRRLSAATDIVVRIAKECVAVAKLGLMMIEIGYAAAKGDPACGVSNAIAGAQSAMWVAFMNLKKCRGKHARAAFAELETAFIEMTVVQTALLEAVAGLRREVDQSMSRQLRLL